MGRITIAGAEEFVAAMNADEGALLHAALTAVCGRPGTPPAIKGKGAAKKRWAWKETTDVQRGLAVAYGYQLEDGSWHSGSRYPGMSIWEQGGPRVVFSYNGPADGPIMHSGYVWWSSGESGA